MDTGDILVILEDGTDVKKRFFAGRVKRVNQQEGNRPLSFDVGIYKGKNEDGTPNMDYVNNIAVRKDSKAAGLVAKFEEGQQVFVEANMVEKEGTDKDGNPKTYKNYWLWQFAYGKPAEKE